MYYKMCAMPKIAVAENMFAEIIGFSKIHVIEGDGVPPDDFSLKHTHVH